MPDIPEAEVRARLAAARVAIVGCGGLGSNVAAMLVRSGVGALVLIDFDVVEEGNLNRQMFFRDQVGRPKVEALAETLRRIDPAIELVLHRERVTADSVPTLLKDVDAIVEAVDGVEDKAMVVDTCSRELPDTPLVAASGLAGYATANDVVTEKVADRVWVVGDLEADVRHGHALLASRVMVAAAHQAHAVIRLLLGFVDP